jgi:hypothetical protein
MSELKIKIWDFSLECFVKNPMEYLEFTSYNTINNQIHIVPKLKSNLNAQLFHCSPRQDINGIDIYEGEQILFFDTLHEREFIQPVIRKGILLHWMLGDHSFDDAINLRIIGHMYNKTPLQSLLNLL